MSLRVQLLAVGAVLGLLPIAGWNLLANLETVMRASEERALLTLADGLARSLDAQSNLPPAARRVTYARPLGYQLRPDGYGDEWRTTERYAQSFADGNLRASVQVGVHGRQLSLWLQIDDPTPVWGDAPVTPPVIDDAYAQPDANRGLSVDHVVMRFETDTGAVSFRFSSAGAGPIRGVRIGGPAVLPPPTGVWQRREDAPGYQIELVVPNAEAVLALGVGIYDHVGAGVGRPEARAGTLDAGGTVVAWPLLRYHSDLSARLRPLLPPGTRAWLLHPDGWVVARGEGDIVETPPRTGGWVWALVYRWFLASELAEPAARSDENFRLTGEEIEMAAVGERAAAWRPASAEYQVIVSAATPTSSRYVLLVDQPNAALGRLVEEGIGGLLTTTLLTFLVAGLALLGYATWLSLRVRRLADAADAAIRRPEQATAFPVSKAGDEIGGLSRSFAALLRELREHNAYLQTLADKLSHELHTPLAVVRSSLENLRQAPLSAEAEGYAERADEGVTRLAAILRAMSEASRLERSIDDSDRETFDLAAVLSGCVDGYRTVHGADRIAWRTDLVSAPLNGAPELIAQMLDKLVDNAVGFSEPGEPIQIELSGKPGGGYRLSVINQGPPLPSGMAGRLFESMVSQRPDRSGSHLGLGLYIVRLIVRYHGGQVRAQSLPDDRGVRVSVDLPIHQ